MSTNITVDKNKVGISQAINGMLQVRNGRELMAIGIACLQTMIDGDGSQVANYANMATQCGFPDAATAQASWNEINSMYGKLSGDGDVTNVHAAVNQCCAKHGI